MRDNAAAIPTDEALRRRARGVALAKRLSLIVGGVRVFFAVLFVVLVYWQFPAIPHRWIFWLYVAAGLAVWLMIYQDIWEKQPRSIAIGLVDAAVLTYLVYLVGVFSFMALAYAIQGLLFALAVGARVALIVTGAGALAYVTLVLAEISGRLSHAPIEPVWLAAPVDHPWLAAGLAFCVVSAIVVAMVTAMRLASQLQLEQQLTEQLLLDILPAPVAERLKATGEPIAERVAEASVVFIDLAGFTEIAGDAPPEQVVGMLNEVFSRFDEIVREYGLEKIKTMGDAYMAVAGVPEPMEDHATIAASASLAILASAEDLRTPGGSPISVRIGIHSGPVVAGVIGVHKFAYDVWGDTVNIASRMESHGTPGRIHVSESFARAIGQRFGVQERGEVSIKGKGKMRTYFLQTQASPRSGSR